MSTVACVNCLVNDLLLSFKTETVKTVNRNVKRLKVKPKAQDTSNTSQSERKIIDPTSIAVSVSGSYRFLSTVCI